MARRMPLRKPIPPEVPVVQVNVRLTAPWDFGDKILVVEGKKIYISKVIVSMLSPVLRAMFTSDFKEKHEQETILPGKKFADVLELMLIIHPPTKDIDIEKVDILLPLAREYQMQDVTNRCEKVLLPMDPDVLNFVRADEYDMPNLREKCLEYMKGTTLRELEQQQAFLWVNSQTKIELLTTLCRRYEDEDIGPAALVYVREVVRGKHNEQNLCDKSTPFSRYRHHVGVTHVLTARRRCCKTLGRDSTCIPSINGL